MTASQHKTLLRLRSLKAKIFDDTIIIQEPNEHIKDIGKALKMIITTRLGV